MAGTPAGAHVGGSVNHLWSHLKPRADERYVNNNESLWAVVESNGDLVRDNRAASAQRIQAGQFEVVFERDVQSCAYVAAIADNGTLVPLAGQIGVAARAGNANAVFVETRDADGVAADRDFHLSVVCNEAPPPPASRTATTGARQPAG
jgi:hypothetical protein